MCSGVFINVLTGYLVSRVHIQKIAVISAVVTAASPALMATMPIDSNYWFAPFWALVLSPVNPDGPCAPNSMSHLVVLTCG